MVAFIDSNVIAYAFYRNEHTEQCQAAIERGGLTNALALIEAFHIIERVVNRKTAERAIRGILKSDINVVAVDVNIVFHALKKARKDRLSIYDLTHYLSAIQHGCEAILSYDKDFDRLQLPRREP